MTQKKAKSKIKKSPQSQKKRLATPTPAKITDPQKVNAKPEQQAIESAESPPIDTPLKDMTSAEKLSLLVLFGILCVNVITLYAMRKEAKLEKRAWIGLQKPITQPIKAGEELSYQIIFANTGKTPSIDTKKLSKWGFDPNDSTMLTFFEEDIPTDPNVGESPLAPNSSLVVSEMTNTTVSESLFGQIQSGEKRMFVLVKIKYKDIFGESHQTHACLRYSPKYQTFVADHKYNYMD